MIRSIFAVDAEGGIGKAGTLPWPKDPEDLRWFKTNTQGGIVVMGKNTWLDPLMPKPLPGRLNAVVTNGDPRVCAPAHVIIPATDLDGSIRRLAADHPDRKVWIIGGALLLTSTWHLMDEIYLTRFDDAYSCDVKIDIDVHLRSFNLSRRALRNKKVFEIYEKLP
jgi:dihydrofolate reductase